MFDKAIQFLKDHKEITLATSEGNLPKLRIFQIMKQEGHVLYFATSPKKAVWRELQQNPNVEILAYATMDIRQQPRIAPSLYEL